MSDIFTQFYKDGILITSRDSGKLLSKKDLEPFSFTISKDGSIHECIITRAEAQHGAIAIDIGMKDQPMNVLRKGLLVGGRFDNPQEMYETAYLPFILQTVDEKETIDIVLPRYLEQIAASKRDGSLMRCFYIADKGRIQLCSVELDTISEENGKASELSIELEDGSQIVSLSSYWNIPSHKADIVSDVPTNVSSGTMSADKAEKSQQSQTGKAVIEKARESEKILVDSVPKLKESEHEIRLTPIITVAAAKFEEPEDGNKILNSQVAGDEAVGVDITSGNTFNLEQQHLKQTVSKISSAIRKIRSLPSYVGKYAVVRGGDDGTELSQLKYQKQSNEGNYQKIADLEGSKGQPYSYRVDVKKGSGVFTNYLGPKRIDDSSGTMIVRSFFSPEGKELLHANEEGSSLAKQVRLIRQFFISRSNLLKYRNILLRGHNKNKNTDVFSKLSDPFLIHVLQSRRQDHELTDIILTIQKKQNQIVEEEYKQNIIVQGCAGSGKTMVMLHRLSRLQNYEKAFNPKEVLILTPSSQYQMYIHSVTEGLAIQNITQRTIEDYYCELLEELGPDLAVQKRDTVLPDWNVDDQLVSYIYSDKFLRVFRDAYELAMESRRQLYAEFRHIYEEIDMSDDLPEEAKDDKDVQKSYREMLGTLRKTDSERQEQYKKVQNTERLLKENAAELEQELQKAEEGQDRIYQESWDNTERAIRQRISVLKQQERNVKTELSVRMMEEFLKTHVNPDSRDIPMLILQASSWSPAIEPYYDACQKSIQEVADLRHQKSTRPKVLKDAADEVEHARRLLFTDEVREEIESLAAKARSTTVLNTYRSVFEEAIKPELERLHFKKPTKLHRFDLYVRLLFARKFYRSEAVSFEFVCIDEGQDLASNEYRLIYELNGTSAHYNIYGDTNQMIHPERGIKSWSSLSDLFHPKFYSLNENYRNSEPINNYCNSYFHMNISTVGLPGPEVKQIGSEDLQKMLSGIDNSSGDRVAIIIPDSMEKTDVSTLINLNHIRVSLDEVGSGIASIVYVDEIKGFEFETVFCYIEGMSRNQQYIAMTRALTNLYVVE